MVLGFLKLVVPTNNFPLLFLVLYDAQKAEYSWDIRTIQIKVRKQFYVK